VADRTVTLRAVIRARRGHGRKLFFLDCGEASAAAAASREGAAAPPLGKRRRASGDGRALQLVCSRATYAGHPGLFDDKKLLVVGSVVACVGHPGRTSRGVLSVYATALELLRVAPTPFAIQRVVEATLATPSLLSESEAMQALQLDAVALDALCRDFARGAAHEGAARAFWKAAVARGRALRGAPAVRVRAERPPRFGARELRALARGEACAAAASRGRWGVVADAPGDVTLKFGKLHPKFNLPSGKANDVQRLRYANEKKAPQIRWMVQRVKEVVAAQGWAVRGLTAASASRTRAGDDDGNGDGPRRVAPLRILDVGGGRGDLALVLAKALPRCLAKGVRCTVTVVDVNAPSLAAGAKRAALNGLDATKIIFAQRDVRELAAELVAQPDAYDVVVGLHACGGLSDAILALIATQRRCGFVVCTCCFCANSALAEEGAAAVLPWWALLEADAPPLQHQQEMSQEVPPQEMVLQVPPQQLSVLHAKRVLCQIAETNANRELSRRAMRAINTLRLAQHEARSGDGGGGHALRLMAFDEAFSPRNLVLIGAALNATVREESVGKVVSAV